MDEGRLTSAMNRAEHALGRIESALAKSRRSNGRDEALRARVRDAVAELDRLIREAAR
jgi:hypothetical protein